MGHAAAVDCYATYLILLDSLHAVLHLPIPHALTFGAPHLHRVENLSDIAADLMHRTGEKRVVREWRSMMYEGEKRKERRGVWNRGLISALEMNEGTKEGRKEGRRI